MRNLKLGLLGVSALAIVGFASQAQAADGTGNASATIVSPIAVTENTAMDFATIIADATGDTITLTPAAAISGTGSSTFSGTAVAGIFDVTGSPSASVNITFSTGDTLTGPGTAMPLGNFAHDAGGTPAFDGSGDLQFSVGADLTVNATQTDGSYSGTYTVSVNYP